MIAVYGLAVVVAVLLAAFGPVLLLQAHEERRDRQKTAQRRQTTAARERAEWLADAEHDTSVTGRAVVPLGWDPDHCPACKAEPERQRQLAWQKVRSDHARRRITNLARNPGPGMTPAERITEAITSRYGWVLPEPSDDWQPGEPWHFRGTGDPSTPPDAYDIAVEILAEIGAEPMKPKAKRGPELEWYGQPDADIERVLRDAARRFQIHQATFGKHTRRHR